VGNACDDESGGGVQQDGVAVGRSFTGEKRLKRAAVFFRRASDDGLKRVDRQVRVFWVHSHFGDHTIFQCDDGCRAGNCNLIRTVRAVDKPSGFGAERMKRFGHGADGQLRGGASGPS